MAEALAPVSTLTVRLWDADFNPVFDVENGWRIDEPDVLAFPVDSPIARWLLNLDHAAFRSTVHLTADCDGRRWAGRLESYEMVKVEGFQQRYMRARFLDERVIEKRMADIAEQIRRFNGDH